MGLSGSKSTSGSAQKWAKPYATAAASSVQGVFNENQPQLRELTKTVTDLVPGLKSNFDSWAPLTQKSQGYYGDVLGGKYMDPTTNPFLESILKRTRGDITDTVNAQFSQAGRYGSGAHTGILTDRLADAENNMYYNDYSRERGYMDSAASMPGQFQDQSLSQILQAAGIGAELPYAGTNSLSNALSALFNGSVQKQSGLGQIVQGLGSAASAAAMASDPRLKENIERVGTLEDGLGVYEWEYLWSDERYRGVMADEVAEFRPWALGPVIDGYMTVDYAAL